MIFFFQKNPSLKKKLFFFEGVKVRENWLLEVNLFYKESKSKKNNFFFLLFFCFFWVGGGGRGDFFHFSQRIQF